VKSYLQCAILACVLALLGTARARGDHAPAVRDGDLIFQTSRSSQSGAIQHATGSAYSHMGLIFVRDAKPYVFEAVATVRFTPLDQWIARGAGLHFVVKRLRNANAILNATGINRLREAALRFAGRPYDLTFDCPTTGSTVRNWSGRPMTGDWESISVPCRLFAISI
jgi:hypothetical protein